MEKSLPWTKKYAPKILSDIRGQPNAVKQVLDFVKNFSRQRNKGLLLYGPTGSGKTSLAYTIAKTTGYELLEVNASDTRNKDSLHKLIGSAINQRSFFSDGKVILVDEIDGLSGMKDRGGITEIVKLLKETHFPMILTCRNPFDRKFKPLLKVCTTSELIALTSQALTALLDHICTSEGVNCPNDILQAIARKSEGDARAAINDLQVIAAGRETISKDDFAELTTRTKIKTIEEGLTTVFKSSDAKLALSAFDEVAEDVDQRFLWLDYNIPFEYTNSGDIARAYGCLSRADVYRRRIRRRQHWRFLVYINALLTAGIASSKNAPYKRPPTYKQTTRLLRIWQVNMSHAKKKAIAQKIALLTHTSTTRIMKDFDLYQMIFKKNKEFAVSFANEANLDKDEVVWMNK
jgi:replication factor C large subunit